MDISRENCYRFCTAEVSENVELILLIFKRYDAHHKTSFSVLLSHALIPHEAAKKKQEPLFSSFSCDRKYFTSKRKFINQKSPLFATFWFSLKQQLLSLTIERRGELFFFFFHTLHNKGKIFCTRRL